MKIKRFDNINENLTSDVKQFIVDFEGNTDLGIIDWVDTVSQEFKINDYIFRSSTKKALNFANSKNLKKLSDIIYENLQSIYRVYNWEIC